MLWGWVNGMMVGNRDQVDKMTAIKIILSFFFITFLFLNTWSIKEYIQRALYPTGILIFKT